MKYTNRIGQTYHLCSKPKKNGGDNFFFKINAITDLVEAVPEGYEIYENPSGQVFCRKIKPKLITDAEMQRAAQLFKRHSTTPHVILDRVDNSVVIWTADRFDDQRSSEIFALRHFLLPPSERDLIYQRAMRFVLTDKKNKEYKEDREFYVQRWCFLGRIDDWIHIGDSGDLQTLIKKYAPHLGKESFYDLM